MDVDVRELGNSRVALHVKLSADEVSGAFDRTYQQLSNRGGIKGFRPGKVPRKILDRYYDADAIRAATYEALVQDRLEEAMELENLRPIDQVEVEVGAPPEEDEILAEKIKGGLTDEEATESEEAEEPAETEEAEEAEEAEEEPQEEIPLQEGEPFEFYSVFTAYPRPSLPDLSDLKLRKPVAEVTDEDVEEQIERLRRINAEEVEVDREEIADSDVVVAKLKVVVEGEDPDEVNATEQEIIVGERDYLGDIDEKLIGHKAGDVVEAEFTYEEDHPDEELAGKSARIIAEIESFSARELPELTDEFAQSLGDYKNLEDLRSSIRQQLEQRAEERAQEELRAQVTRRILEGTEVELPEEFVEQAAERSLEDLRGELQQMGMSIEEFAEATGQDEEELRNSQRARAESGLKLHFAIEALAREREIEVTDEDVAVELRRIAEESGGDMEFVQQAAMLQPNFAEEVQDRAMRRKLFEDLIASAEIEEVPADQYAQEAAEREASEPEPAEAEPAGEAVEEVETATESEAAGEAAEADDAQESEET